MDAYLTLAEPASARLTRDRSRFLALVEPATCDRVEARIAALVRQHHDVTHVCFAYRCRQASEIVSRADDAGEPRGSAGLPILQQLEAAGLVDVLAVVVRHFGGVKLGLGGLVRAYGDVTAAALAEAKLVEQRIETMLRVRFPHAAGSAAMRAAHRHGARVLDIRYDTEGEMVVALAPSRAQAFAAEIREATGTRGTVTEET
jgi:putative IMPACT (imprinted ancient) family translation regulator